MCWRQRLRLAFAMLLAMLASSACSFGTESPVHVTLAQLATYQDSYNGQKIATEGTLLELENSDGTNYYLIEDSQHNRVEIKSAESPMRYVGQQVAVIGTFSVDTRQGRWISVDELSTLTT